jgi:hypothetical protein
MPLKSSSNQFLVRFPRGEVGRKTGVLPPRLFKMRLVKRNALLARGHMY